MQTKILCLGPVYFQIDNFHFNVKNGLTTHSQEPVGSDYIIGSGGSVPNFASVCKALGMQPLVSGKIGNDIPGKELTGILEKKEIHFKPVLSPNHQTNLAINYISDNDEVIFTVSGTANQSLEEGELEESLKELLPSVKYLYLGGSFKLRSLLPGLHRLVNLAKSLNVLVILDHNRITTTTTDEEKKIMKDIIPLVDFYFPSRDELINLFEFDELEDAILHLKDSFKNTIVVKDADKGAIGIQNGEIVRVPAYLVKVLNSVGAGDSFNAGFIAAYDEGKTFEDAIKFGCATAAAKISTHSALTRTAVDEMVKSA